MQAEKQDSNSQNTPGETAPVSRIETLTVPTSAELFLALGRTARPNWSSAGRSIVNMAASDRVQIAMNIGTVIADGYLAVENQNSQEVKNTGKDIVELAKKLNVGERVIMRGKSISDFADTNDWNSLREELEATQSEIKLSLIEQRDEPLVPLISLGTWLRTIQAASGIVERAPSPEASEVLLQPGIPAYFYDRLQQLPEKVRSRPLLLLAQESLQSLHNLLSESPRRPEQEAVAEVGKLSSELVAIITGTRSLEIEVPARTDTGEEGAGIPPQTAQSAEQQTPVPESGVRPEPTEATATAQRKALELAAAFSNDGFKIRDGRWTSLLPAGQKQVLEVHLFAGNQYWFSASVAEEGANPRLVLRDSEGTEMPVLTYSTDSDFALGVLPKKSGIYHLELQTAHPEPSTFCVVYSYK